MDIVQDEVLDTAGAATQQHHSPSNSEVASPNDVQDVNNPRRYPTHTHQGQIITAILSVTEPWTVSSLKGPEKLRMTVWYAFFY